MSQESHAYFGVCVRVRHLKAVPDPHRDLYVRFVIPSLMPKSPLVAQDVFENVVLTLIRISIYHLMSDNPYWIYLGIKGACGVGTRARPLNLSSKSLTIRKKTPSSWTMNRTRSFLKFSMATLTKMKLIVWTFFCRVDCQDLCRTFWKRLRRQRLSIPQFESGEKVLGVLLYVVIV